MTLEIFVPFWGDPALLYETVDSVRAQRNPDWRLTVIDDCYPDERVPAYFAELDDARVSYTRNDVNLGITENYREAIRRATTEYIAILGCDDLLHPNYVDVVTRTMTKVPHADVIQPGVRVIDEHGTIVNPLADRVKQGVLAPRGGDGTAVLTGERMATSLIRGDWLYWPSLTFRTETLQRIDFREGLPIIQDLALLMDIAFDGGTLAYNPTLAFSYRRHGGSASQKTLLDGRRFRDERRYYAEARRVAEAHGWSRTACTARARVMSRLHAITELPKVLRGGNRTGIESTLAHIVAL
ncbi:MULTISPECIES: glycosyltransferase [unclassified Microbacterium]|uniref:glycosyltransferase n=1 Tax=unclassified Microbacterium TaxID=2609290 RepID=UPI00214B3D46|nr:MULTISPECIES: glycosyltransferase [unclassified Microbacterium]MCR2810245.1 glycosyltransferase [Microbacterium sp. zg.B185]WIM19926.1 glycosyltransferase [Microbacterium sp. zg-B185]